MIKTLLFALFCVIVGFVLLMAGYGAVGLPAMLLGAAIEARAVLFMK